MAVFAYYNNYLTYNLALIMIKILADASLPGLTHAFPAPFALTLYPQNSAVPTLIEGHDVLLCRSTLSINASLFEQHAVKIVATASSGIDHVDEALLAQKGICLLDAKGCNAHSVADYVVACLAYLKTTYGIPPKKAGVIGVGAVGSLVVKRLQAMGLSVVGYDPPRADQDPNFKGAALSELFDCDLLCIHANRHDKAPYPSLNLLDESFLKQLRPGTVLINASRGGIVNEDALLTFENDLIYCTDVYTNEPHIDSRIVQYATLCTPHIAGHSIEAKARAVTLLSEKLHDYYQLPHPIWSEPTPTIPASIIRLNSDSTWANTVLSLYDPSQETQQLKAAAPPLDTEFINTRRAHNNRHDFNYS